MFHCTPEIVNVHLFWLFNVVLLDQLRVLDFSGFVYWAECFNLGRVLHLLGWRYYLIRAHCRDRVIIAVLTGAFLRIKCRVVWISADPKRRRRRVIRQKMVFSFIGRTVANCRKVHVHRRLVLVYTKVLNANVSILEVSKFH